MGVEVGGSAGSSIGRLESKDTKFAIFCIKRRLRDLTLGIEIPFDPENNAFERPATKK